MLCWNIWLLLKFLELITVYLSRYRQKSTLKKQLEEFSPCDPSVTDFKIMVVGEVGTGKSSFINFVNNVFQDRITCAALVSSFAGTIFTKRVGISHSRAFVSFILYITDFKTNVESHGVSQRKIYSKDLFLCKRTKKLTN